MGLREGIEKVIEAGDATEEERDAINEKHNPSLRGITMGGDVWQAMQAEPRPASEALYQLLDSFPLETLQRMYTLMYAGRDGHDNIKRFHESQGSKQTKEGACAQIHKKKPRSKFFSDGLALAEQLGFDIENGW